MDILVLSYVERPTNTRRIGVGKRGLVAACTQSIQVARGQVPLPDPYSAYMDRCSRKDQRPTGAGGWLELFPSSAPTHAVVVREVL